MNPPTTWTSKPCAPSKKPCRIRRQRRRHPHDRWFLDRICTHILAFEGNSEVVWFEGNYSEYEEDRKKRIGVDADTPHRVRFRSLHA